MLQSQNMFMYANQEDVKKKEKFSNFKNHYMVYINPQETYLSENLFKVDFKQSEVYPCLFISEKVICLVYVDDTLFFSPNVSDINRVLEKLKG